MSGGLDERLGKASLGEGILEVAVKSSLSLSLSLSLSPPVESAGKFVTKSVHC
jgi:hypothetical protein